MDEPNANASLLRELALRLATYPADPRVDDPQLLVGQIPPNLSIEVPIPEGSRILGSLLRSKENIDIVLDCALSPDEVVQFYKERLAAAGWNELETMRPLHGGFVTTRAFGFQHHAVFCLGSQGTSFSVNAQPGKNATSHVRIDLNTSSEFSPCLQMSRQRMHRGLHELIPPLYPPQGARQQDGGGSGSMGSWYTSATLLTDAELPALVTHYHPQLVKGGWTLTGEGQSGPLAWSTWTFQDEDKESWRGLFFILKSPGRDNQFILVVRIEWDKKDDDGRIKQLLLGGRYSWSSQILGRA
jgi:hypothetical protein